MIHDKPINVMSLFNGMSTGHQALKNLGFVIGNYYSSEIKPAAIKLTAHHFPETMEMGNILNWRNWDVDWSAIDVVLSGSPCKDLSIAGKRKGIDGSNCGLFWVLIDILNHIKKLNPNVLFFQENVGSAPRKDIGIMSRALGVYPIRINSSLVTAQLRDRYYWSNIRTKQDGMFGDIVTDVPMPNDKQIAFRDVVTDGFVCREKSTALQERQSTSVSYKDITSDKAQKYMKSRAKIGMLPVVYYHLSNLLFEHDGRLAVKTNTKRGFDYLTENDCLNLAFEKSTTRRGRLTKGKAPCLLASNEPLYSVKGIMLRLLNKIELCRLQGFPDDYCDILTRNESASLLGDGWTLPIVEHFLQYLPFKRIS